MREVEKPLGRELKAGHWGSQERVRIVAVPVLLKKRVKCLLGYIPEDILKEAEMAMRIHLGLE